jgi:hypothetical protein
MKNITRASQRCLQRFSKIPGEWNTVNSINPMGPLCFQLNKTENDNGSSSSKKQLQNVKPSRGSYFAKIF